jgi:hypothetical protein
VPELLGGDSEGPFGIDLLAPDPLLDGLQEDRIERDQRVRREDRRELRADSLGRAAGEVRELRRRGLGGDAQSRALLVDAAGFDRQARSRP